MNSVCEMVDQRKPVKSYFQLESSYNYKGSYNYRPTTRQEQGWN